jgi:hypothetical protein
LKPSRNKYFQSRKFYQKLWKKNDSGTFFLGKIMLSRRPGALAGLAGRARGLALAAFFILTPHTVHPSRACLHDRVPPRQRPCKHAGHPAKGAAEGFVHPFWGSGGRGVATHARALLHHRPAHPGTGLPARWLRVGSTSLLHVRCLNRLLIDPWEVRGDGSGKIAIVLPAEDGRVKHVRKILKSEDGNTLRIGVVDAGTEEDAVVRWQEDGALKLA